MPVISITRLRLRKARFLPGFFLAAMRIVKQARASQGNLAVRVFVDSHKAFWTATAWSSDAAMRAFMLAEPHGPAMRKLLDWCDEAALLHWTQPDAALPAWPEAHRRLIAEGRPSKVNYPTPAHTAHTPAPPKRDSRTEIK